MHIYCVYSYIITWNAVPISSTIARRQSWSVEVFAIATVHRTQRTTFLCATWSRIDNTTSFDYPRCREVAAPLLVLLRSKLRHQHLMIFIEACTTAPRLCLLGAIVLTTTYVVTSMAAVLFTSCLIQRTWLLDTNLADIRPRTCYSNQHSNFLRYEMSTGYMAGPGLWPKQCCLSTRDRKFPLVNLRGMHEHKWTDLHWCHLALSRHLATSQTNEKINVSCMFATIKHLPAVVEMRCDVSCCWMSLQCEIAGPRTNYSVAGFNAAATTHLRQWTIYLHWCRNNHHATVPLVQIQICHTTSFVIHKYFYSNWVS